MTSSRSRSSQLDILHRRHRDVDHDHPIFGWARRHKTRRHATGLSTFQVIREPQKWHKDHLCPLYCLNFKLPSVIDYKFVDWHYSTNNFGMIKPRWPSRKCNGGCWFFCNCFLDVGVIVVRRKTIEVIINVFLKSTGFSVNGFRMCVYYVALSDWIQHCSQCPGLR